MCACCWSSFNSFVVAYINLHLWVNWCYIIFCVISSHWNPGRKPWLLMTAHLPTRGDAEATQIPMNRWVFMQWKKMWKFCCIVVKACWILSCTYNVCVFSPTKLEVGGYHFWILFHTFSWFTFWFWLFFGWLTLGFSIINNYQSIPSSHPLSLTKSVDHHW